MESLKKEDSSVGTINKDQFSPVSKLQSAKSTHGRNLTGPARHVRDLAADIHANIQQWNSVHLKGLSLLKSITQEKQDESYSQILQELCNQLEDVCDTLDNIAKNLGQIAHQMKVTTSLHKSTERLFTTWPATKFGDVAELIYNAYNEGAEIKRKVLEDVAHYHTESWKMLCLATWVHQPSLPENLTISLESLLLETGHR